jgi:RHS repeat-associated protein
MPKRQGRNAPKRLPFSRRFLSSSRSFAALALIGAVAVVNIALPHAAESQINGRVVSAPKFSAGTPHVTRAKLPKAPVQVAMPAPPPMKIVPGMEEVLVATGPVGVQESAELDAALKEFHDSPAKAAKDGDFSDFSKPLLAFIAAHPKSNWNAALHTNVGFGYYHDGYYSHAFIEFEQAWQLGRNATSPQAHILIDRAVGELAKMHARVGHKAELEAVLKDIGNRPIGGPGTELVELARGALNTFKLEPGISYLCGPKALENVLITLKASKKQIQVAEDAQSGPNGVSLPQLALLATKAGLKYKLIHREPGQPVPVPSIVNWNVHHYAAITGEGDGRYIVKDPTFGVAGGTGELTQKAIDAESSGYFLVPAQVMLAHPKSGWRNVSADSAEAKAVYGKGVTYYFFLGLVAFCDTCQTAGALPDITAPNTYPGGKSGPQMTVARGTPTTVNLHLEDTPVGYKPQIGLPNRTTITYNAHEDLQPATFGFSNLSSKWSHGWMSYITFNPGTANTYYQRSAGGGGGYYIGSMLVPSTGAYYPENADNSQTFRVPAVANPTSFVRNMPDGGKEVFGLSNGATVNPAIRFLTQVVDAQGNTTTLNYDSSFRLTSVVDPMGRSTTYTYGLSGYPLLLTKVTDPFGRTAQLTYDTSARLSTITDPVGITSTFTYSATEPTFVTNLTTPYGTSTFNDTNNPNDPPYSGTSNRTLTLTDPLGYTDYLYFNQNATVTGIPNTDPTATLPAGMPEYDQWLSTRNVFYWNKHQFAACLAAGGCSVSGGVVQSEDFTKAAITHYDHQRYYADDLSRQASSIKQPLEHRVWFAHFQESGSISGVLDLPVFYGRVLDDGSTQLNSATFYNTGGYSYFPWPLTKTDPMGRETVYNYDTNHIDLLTVQQKTSGSGFTTIGTYGSYNTQHEPQTWTGADGKTWNYTWNTVGQIATITDPNTGVTTYNYDTSGRLSTIVNANTATVLTNTYDSADRIQTQTDSEGYTLTYAYDNLDRITSITYPDSTTDLYDYNFQSGPYVGTASLELRKHTDRLGRVTTYAYDADRRLTSVTEPTSGSSTRTTGYSYYEDGTLKEITDANGNVTHWDIDIESRPIDKIYAYGTASAQTETYAYETTTSRLKSITDALGQVKAFTYAKDNRITGITYTSSVNTTPNVTFTWDTYFPRLTKMVDGLGTTNYSYTAIGTNGGLKLSSIDGPYSNDVIGLTYDALGRLSGRNITGGNETFGYDAISRLTSHGTPLGSFTEGYLGQTDQMTSQSVTNGSVTVSTGWGYDTNTNDRRLTSITNSGVTRSYSLGYGSGPVNVYDIQSITDTAAAGHPWATQSHAYTNDLIDRLLTETVTTPGNSTFAYDNLDNATTWNTPASGSLSPSFNGLNQLSTFGANTYSYDADGNTRSGDGVKAYKWDAENRLIEIDYTGTSNKSVFSYDGVGHRTVDAETISGTTTTTKYLWCGSSICQTRDGSDTVLRRNLGEGEYNVSTGQKLIYMPDQLGSVRDVIDGTSGNLVQSYDYTPYGGVARSNGSTPTDYQYAGLFNHSASGLNLSATRALDGNTGRWLNRDPIKEYGGLNLYSYGASPIMGVDPYGLLQFPFGPPDPATQQQLARILGTEAATLEEGGSEGPLGILGATIAIIWGTPDASQTAQSDDNCKCQNSNHPDIYRGGNASGPKLGNVRPKDFPGFPEPLQIVGPPGGISSQGSIGGTGPWWKFPAGSPLPEGICLVNDSGDHWLWRPATNMPLSTYIQLLQTTGPAWTRVQ